MATQTIFIDGMSCGHCLNAVNKAIQSVPNARLQSVAIGRAVVEAEPAVVAEVMAAIEAAGYHAHRAPENP
jgi:copper chaperone CopZ